MNIKEVNKKFIHKNSDDCLFRLIIFRYIYYNSNSYLICINLFEILIFKICLLLCTSLNKFNLLYKRLFFFYVLILILIPINKSLLSMIKSRLFNFE